MCVLVLRACMCMCIRKCIPKYFDMHMVQHWIGVFMLQLCDCIWFYVCVCVTVCACVGVYIEYLSVYVCLMSLVHTSVWFGACILCLRLCVWSFIERNRVWGRRMWN